MGLLHLPRELLEAILCHLPPRDYFRGVHQTCRHLRALLSEPTFLPQKRRYYSYLYQASPFPADLDVEQWKVELRRFKECPLARMLQQGLPTLWSETSIAGALEWLLQRVIRNRGRRPIPETWSRHSDLSWAESLTRRRWPQSCQNPWAILTVCVLLLDRVEQVLALVRFLEADASHDWSARDVLDWLYEVATYVKFLERTFDLPKQCHFVLHHALFVLENQGQSIGAETKPPNTPQVPVWLTVEQRRIVHYPINIQARQTVKVVAFAGTGKTTVLKHLTRVNPGVHFLLVVFNKGIQEQSCGSFPRNVSCVTANSLAYTHLVNQGYPRTRLKPFSLKAHDVIDADALPRRGEGSGNIFTRAAQLLTVLRNFSHSRDDVIALEHVPHTWQVGSDSPPESLSQRHRQHLLEDSRAFWQLIADRNSFLRITIEGAFQMKLFQLAKPNFKQMHGKLDVILIDEGQDMNPAMLDLLLSQKCPKFIVGDPGQQIYSFNGAVNGLALVEQYSEVGDTFRLSQSFRFGAKIAYLATVAVQCFRNNDTDFVMGVPDKLDTLIGHTLFTPARARPPLAVLARTNLCLFQAIVQETCMVPESERPVIALVKGLEQYFTTLVDLVYFYRKQTQQISSSGRYLLRYESFDVFEQRAKWTNDKEAEVKIKIVKEFHENLPDYVQIIAKCSHNHHPNDPAVQLVFSTVHKFKGLEFPRVRLLDDFIVECDFDARRVARNVDEFNLLYVALTRARCEVVLNNSLLNLLLISGRDNFTEYLPRASWLKHSSYICLYCLETLPYSQDSSDLIISRQKIALTAHTKIAGGILCPRCSLCAYMLVPTQAHGVSDVEPRRDNKRVFLSPLWMPEERGITSDNSGKEYRMRQHFKHIVIRHKPVPIVYVLESPELFDESDDDFLLSV